MASHSLPISDKISPLAFVVTPATLAYSPSRPSRPSSSLDLDIEYATSTAAPSLAHQPISTASTKASSSCSSAFAAPGSSAAGFFVVNHLLALRRDFTQRPFSSSVSLTTQTFHLAPTPHTLCVSLPSSAAPLGRGLASDHLTGLPTIASELSGPSTLYTWVGVAYILPQTVLQPLWGKMADITGRKSMMWLVIARGVSGAGAGGVVPMVWIITGEVVPTQDRAKWSDTLTCVWAASALAGPLLGGVFSVWINAPVCVLAAALLLIFLRDELPGNDPRPWKAQLVDLNYLGLGLLVSGTTAILLGFSEASSTGWDKPSTIALLVAGAFVLVGACIQETCTKKTRFIPAGIFAKTGAILSFGSFFQTFAFTAGTFYLALFFQAVTGASAIQAGFLLLPFSLGSALISLVANLYIRKKGDPKHMVILGFGIASLGYGLMILLDQTSCKFMTVSIPLIAGLGMGLLFRSPFAAMEKALPEKDRAPMTACFFLVRFIGTSVGLAAAGAIFDTRVQQTMPAGFTIDTTGSVDWRALVKIADPQLRTQVLAAVSAAVSLIWVLCTPLLSISCLLSFFIDGEKKAENPRSITDVEKQVPSKMISESFGDEKAVTGTAHDIASVGVIVGTLANSTSNSATTSTTTLPLSTPRSVDEPAYPEKSLECPSVTSIPDSRSPSLVALRSPAEPSAV
ncbi:hypothetical protein FRB90_012434 [Tulasnella sp. 427]|nr:hypothetical protein FRB90_012434 [Tulasnella sp. 427]